MLGLGLLLCLAAWGDWPEPHVVARGVPKTSQRKDALDEMQRALEQWQTERRAFGEEQRLQATAARKVTQGAGRVVREAVPVETHLGRGHAKVIELKRDRLEGEVDEAEAEVKAHEAECAKDPKPCEERRRRAELIEQGNEAWERAEKAAEEKRNQKIEEDVRRFQAQLDAAKRKEAEREAKKLGGSVDAEGNFVDDDLK